MYPFNYCKLSSFTFGQKGGGITTACVAIQRIKPFKCSRLECYHSETVGSEYDTYWHAFHVSLFFNFSLLHLPPCKENKLGEVGLQYVTSKNCGGGPRFVMFHRRWNMMDETGSGERRIYIHIYILPIIQPPIQNLRPLSTWLSLAGK